MSTWTLVGTLPGGAGGAINVHPQQLEAVIQQVKADLTRAPVSVGVGVALLPVQVTVPETVGISVDDVASGTSDKPLHTAGVTLSSKISGGGSPPQSVGAEIIQAKIDLTQTTYATTQAVTGSWANGANAVGANNGTFATNANTLTAASSGQLTLGFASQVNKTDLVISQVLFSRYWKYSAGLVTPGTWITEYSVDGGANWTVINSAGAGSTFDASVTPDVLDLTSVINGDWSKLTNFKARFTLTGGSSATVSTLSVDAVKLVVVASKTDIL